MEDEGGQRGAVARRNYHDDGNRAGAIVQSSDKDVRADGRRASSYYATALKPNHVKHDYVKHLVNGIAVNTTGVIVLRTLKESKGWMRAIDIATLHFGKDQGSFVKVDHQLRRLAGLGMLETRKQKRPLFFTKTKRRRACMSSRVFSEYRYSGMIVMKPFVFKSKQKKFIFTEEEVLAAVRVNEEAKKLATLTSIARVVKGGTNNASLAVRKTVKATLDGLVAHGKLLVSYGPGNWDPVKEQYRKQSITYHLTRTTKTS